MSGVPSGPLYVRGHDAQKVALRGLGAHTLLFTGPSGVGRRQLAYWYGALLNCARHRDSVTPEPCGTCPSCQLAVSGSHPDVRTVSPQLETSTGKRARRPEIRIGQLVPRDKGDAGEPPLSRWLEARPHFRKRVGVVDSAHSMNISAANAFLKMLEEPPGHALIILIAPSTESVLPTIASRSAPLRFGTVDFSADPTAATHPTARLGRLGDVKTAEANADAFEEAGSVLADYVNALDKGLENALEATDAFEKLWSSAPPFSSSDLLLAHFSRFPPAQYAAAAAALARFETALEAYASPGLAAQVLTLELRAARGGPALS